MRSAEIMAMLGMDTGACRAGLDTDRPHIQLLCHVKPQVRHQRIGWNDMSDETLMTLAPSGKMGVNAPARTADMDDAEALALLETFDGRLTEAERRIDRVLARLGVE